ncbi:hypothetical protein EGK14_09765 [Erwinia sp. 198]|nr:hypothetical protein EGK14_09765 [Erwinia sp. 198]
MNKFFRIAFILFYLVCMVLIYLSMVDKYDVIYDMDSTIPQGSLNNNRGNGNVFGGLALSFIFILYMVFFYVEKSKKWKCLTGIMTALIRLFFFIR